MGYPRALEVLVVEDEQKAKAAYEAMFERLRGKGADLHCRYAFCLQDAVEALASETAFHLVILDLLIPDHPGHPPPTVVENGLMVLDLCANRDAYPVPVLLVISGHLDQARQTELQSRVLSGFSFGRVLAKGVGLDDDLETAVRNAHRYTDVGIHLRNGGSFTYPTLSPRDDDLLRRCVLDQSGCSGVDVEWWSAESCSPTCQEARGAGWTKVLMGKFVLDDGAGMSRPTFFKLWPSDGAESVFRAADVMQHKLGHINIRSKCSSGTAAVLVTEKVGEESGRPTSLASFLMRDPSSTLPFLPGIVDDVCSQTDRLGTESPDELPIASILWSWHDLERIRNQYEKHSCPPPALDPTLFSDPAEVYDTLRLQQTPIRLARQSCIHGDLNITNIALDVGAKVVRGYIFDAAAFGGGFSGWDLATLEVTTLLHSVGSLDEGLVEYCGSFYNQALPADLGFVREDATSRQRNSASLVYEIRQRVLERVSPEVYALMVFDNALMQLGGLDFQVSRNKITLPSDAALLAALAAGWLIRVSPQWFAK